MLRKNPAKPVEQVIEPLVVGSSLPVEEEEFEVEQPGAAGFTDGSSETLDLSATPGGATLTGHKPGLRGIQRQYSKGASDELEMIKRDLLDGEFFNVVAKRYKRSLSNIQYWAKKWQIPSHPDRLKKTVAAHARKAQKLALAEAKEAHKLSPDTAQGVLWTILLDKGQPASARVSAFEKLHAVAGWGIASDQVLPEPSTPDELVERVLDYLNSLHPRVLSRILKSLQGVESRETPEVLAETEVRENIPVV